VNDRLVKLVDELVELVQAGLTDPEYQEQLKQAVLNVEKLVRAKVTLETAKRSESDGVMRVRVAFDESE